MPNQPKTPGRTVRIEDALWQQLSETRQEGETMTDAVRNAIRSYVKVAAAVLAVVALFVISGCGSAEPTAQADPAPSVEVSEPVETSEAVEPVEDCWTIPADLVQRLNEAASSDAAQLAILQELPPVEDGCKKSDRETLTTLLAERDRLDALVNG